MSNSSSIYAHRRIELLIPVMLVGGEVAPTKITAEAVAA